METEKIHIRDPFILVENGTYYLYGTTDDNVWAGKSSGFKAYTSTDLIDWDGPFDVFLPPDGFWGDENFWAPEVYHYKGQYYMIASFKSENCCRGSQILCSKDPIGLFEPLTDCPFTPASWKCLDASLFIDSNGKPWAIFSHEWLQVKDGEIWAVELSEHLNKTNGAPKLLFTASSAKWSRQVENNSHCFVTDDRLFTPVTMDN